jgi:hypothetical protein
MKDYKYGQLWEETVPSANTLLKVLLLAGSLGFLMALIFG